MKKQINHMLWVVPAVIIVLLFLLNYRLIELHRSNILATMQKLDNRWELQMKNASGLFFWNQQVDLKGHINTKLPFDETDINVDMNLDIQAGSSLIGKTFHVTLLQNPSYVISVPNEIEEEDEIIGIFPSTVINGTRVYQFDLIDFYGNQPSISIEYNMPFYTLLNNTLDTIKTGCIFETLKNVQLNNLNKFAINLAQFKLIEIDDLKLNLNFDTAEENTLKTNSYFALENYIFSMDEKILQLLHTNFPKKWLEEAVAKQGQSTFVIDFSTKHNLTEGLAESCFSSDNHQIAIRNIGIISNVFKLKISGDISATTPIDSDIDLKIEMYIDEPKIIELYKKYDEFFGSNSLEEMSAFLELLRSASQPLENDEKLLTITKKAGEYDIKISGQSLHRFITEYENFMNAMRKNRGYKPMVSSQRKEDIAEYSQAQ